MVIADWKQGNSEDGGEPSAFPCLHRTARGRIFHCREIRRVIIGFLGGWLVLTQSELTRLREHFRRITDCRLTRSRFEGGERVRLGDSVGGRALFLGLPEVQELSELMDAGLSSLDSTPSGVCGIPVRSLEAGPDLSNRLGNG